MQAKAIRVMNSHARDRHDLFCLDRDSIFYESFDSLDSTDRGPCTEWPRLRQLGVALRQPSSQRAVTQMAEISVAGGSTATSTATDGAAATAEIESSGGGEAVATAHDHTDAYSYVDGGGGTAKSDVKRRR
jgi:hypothetical protein